MRRITYDSSDLEPREDCDSIIPQVSLKIHTLSL